MSERDKLIAHIEFLEQMIRDIIAAHCADRDRGRKK